MRHISFLTIGIIHRHPIPLSNLIQTFARSWICRRGELEAIYVKSARFRFTHLIVTNRVTRVVSYIPLCRGIQMYMLTF